MKIFRFLKRGIRDSFKSVFRNFSLSMAASIIVTYNVKNITDKLESELTIVVYLKKDVDAEKIETLNKAFVQMKNVEEVTFKDADEWELDMKEFSDTYSTALDYLDENPL